MRRGVLLSATNSFSFHHSSTAMLWSPRRLSAAAAASATFNSYYYRIPRMARVSLLGLGCASVFLLGNYSGKAEWEKLEALTQVPDADAISKDLMSTFEFRPDLAPTMIRLAFVMSVLRSRHRLAFEKQQQQSSFSPTTPRLSGADAADWNICSSFSGLDEAVEVLTFHHMAHNVSMSDLAVIAAIAAVKFLKGPADGLVFKYGRTDAAVESVVLAEEAVAAAAKREERAERKRQLEMSKRASVRMMSNVGNDENPLEGGGRKAFFKDAVKNRMKNEINSSGDASTRSPPSSSALNDAEDPSAILAMMRVFLPGLSDEQIASLFALHGCGEYHRDVSGVERRVKPSRCNYLLSSQYYRTITRVLSPPADENDASLAAASSLVALPVPRSQQNKHVPQLPHVVEAPIQVLGLAGDNKVRRICACPVSEYKLLLHSGEKSSTPLLKKYVERFSDKDFGQQIWAHAFSGALQCIFDAECEAELKSMPDKEELAKRTTSWFNTLYSAAFSK